VDENIEAAVRKRQRKDKIDSMVASQ